MSPWRTALLLLTLGACGGASGDDDGAATPDGGDPGDAGDGDPVELEIGSAAADGTGFVPADQGVDVELIGGAQGGFHIWTGARVRGRSGALRIVRTARRVSDRALVLGESPFVFEVPDLAETSWWQAEEALPSFMCPSPIGIGLRDQPIEVRAELVDGDGAVITVDVITVTPRCPTGDGAAFCAEICSG